MIWKVAYQLSLAEQDAPFYNEIRNDAANAWSLNWYSYSPETIEATLMFIRKKKIIFSLFGYKIVIELDMYKPPMETVGPNYIEFRHVGIFIDPAYRGKGYGKRALELIAEKRTSKFGLIAKVDSRNFPSINLFKSAGYEIAGNIPVIDSAKMQECHIVYLVKKF